MFAYGMKVRSIRDPKLVGHVVGYGSVTWPTNDPDMNGDAGIPQPCLLVQVARGSSGLGPACAVWRADLCVEARDEII